MHRKQRNHWTLPVGVSNRRSEPATLHVLPTLWVRNTWARQSDMSKPSVKQVTGSKDIQPVAALHPTLGERYLYCDGDIPLLGAPWNWGRGTPTSSS